MVTFTRPVTTGSQQWQLYYASVDGSRPAVPIGLDHPNDDNGGFLFSPDGTEVILYTQGSTSLIDVATGKATPLSGIPGLPELAAPRSLTRSSSRSRAGTRLGWVPARRIRRVGASGWTAAQ